MRRLSLAVRHALGEARPRCLGALLATLRLSSADNV